MKILCLIYLSKYGIPLAVQVDNLTDRSETKKTAFVMKPFDKT